MNYLLVCYITTIIILLFLLIVCIGNQLHTTIRITNVVNCDTKGLKWFVDNVSVYYLHPKTYLNCRYHVTEEIKKLNKLQLHIERCNDQGYNCEDFQNWRLDRFCRMLLLKNQGWTEYLSRIHPPLRCPVKKTIYDVRNATIDVDALMDWFPEMIKYRWKTMFKIFNEQDRIVFCGSFESQLHQFRIQDRKPSRKPR